MQNSKATSDLSGRPSAKPQGLKPLNPRAVPYDQMFDLCAIHVYAEATQPNPEHNAIRASQPNRRGRASCHELCAGRLLEARFPSKPPIRRLARSRELQRAITTGLRCASFRAVTSRRSSGRRRSRRPRREETRRRRRAQGPASLASRPSWRRCEKSLVRK